MSSRHLQKSIMPSGVFRHFCDHNHLHFINPDVFTVCLFITHLIHWFHSARSMRNYMSGIRIFHKELGISLAALDPFQVSSTLRAAAISICTPLRCLPILPLLLYCICLLPSSLGPLGPSVLVCLTCGFFAMLRQSNLGPPSASAFDLSRHTCQGDIITAP